MSIAAYMNALTSKKQELENEISYETKRPMPNFSVLADLKKKKLAVKTMIYNLQFKQEPATA